MENEIQRLITAAYAAFNSRDIDAALSTFHPEIHWPRAFKGGYVKGHSEVRAYWTAQWEEINPIVEPLQIIERKNGTFAVKVHQTVKDLNGKLVFDGIIKHIYTLEDHLLQKMDIELD